ncbi:MAG: hypothetical protein OET55_02850, partial [Desulfuromonadales bacterium]|nr:hypothetical protein [Desulfuromonadales bacterium]
GPCLKTAPSRISSSSLFNPPHFMSVLLICLYPETLNITSTVKLFRVSTGIPKIQSLPNVNLYIYDPFDWLINGQYLMNRFGISHLSE